MKRALIVGGGVAALEAALALRDLAAGEVEVEMRAPRAELHYRPLAVGQPFGTASVRRYPLAELAERGGFSFVLGAIAAVRPERRRAIAHEGEEVGYDFLVDASGSRALESLPGAATFWGTAEEATMSGLVERLRGGDLAHLVFTLPSRATWALPIYELALLAAAERERAAATGTRITVVTPEDGPLAVFGERASHEVGRWLADRGVSVLARTHPVKFEGGRLHVVPGEPIAADAAIGLPRLEGRRIDGVPHDEDGFVPVDDHCRVLGLDRVYAAGDVTSFPVEQGGIAAQQADAAAESIAAAAGVDLEPRPFDPVLRAVLWTGEEPRYLYARLGGGHGETSSFSAQPPWSQREGKIVGRYITPFLASLDARQSVDRD